MRFQKTVTFTLIGSALKQVLAVLVLIEAVFLAESLTGLLEQVLRIGGSLPLVAYALALTAPEIFDFALPLALLIGIYVAFYAAREDREIVVLSAAGVSWSFIPKVALAMGIAGFVASLAVSGYLNPAMAHVKRAMLFELKAAFIFDAISEPGREDAIQTIQGQTFISLASERDGEIFRRLFVHQPGGTSGWRVTQADGWTLDGPDENGKYSLGLGRVVAYDFKDDASTGSEGILSEGRGPNLRHLPETLLPEIPALPLVRVKQVSLPVRLDNILQMIPRALVAAEWTFSDVIGLGERPDAPEERVRRRAGEMIARALLCLFAPLIALAGLIAARSGAGRFFALPGACAALLTLDTLSRAALGQIAEGGLFTLAGVSTAMTLLLGTVLLGFAFLRSERFVIPVGQRA